MDDDLSVHDEALYRIELAIGTDGFFIMGVLGDREYLPWSYTVGFLDHDHPEVVVIGLDHDCSASFLHEVYRRISAGDPPPVGREHRHEHRGVPYCLVPIPRDEWLREGGELLLYCVEYYGAVHGRFPSEPRAVQLVWPDEHNRLPWDDGCCEHVRRDQPLLDDDSVTGEAA